MRVLLALVEAIGGLLGGDGGVLDVALGSSQHREATRNPPIESYLVTSLVDTAGTDVGHSRRHFEGLCWESGDDEVSLVSKSLEM